MSRLTLSLATLALLAGGAGAVPVPDDKPVAPPKGPPPGLVVVSRVDAGRQQFDVVETVTRNQVVQVEREMIVNGMRVRFVVTETVPVQEQRVVRRSLKGSRASTADGKPLTAAEAVRRLAPGSVVLYSTDGNPVDPAYLRVVQPETVVLVPPRPPAGPPMPGPVPIEEKRKVRDEP